MVQPSQHSLERRSLGEQLADHLRREIFFGELTPQERLTQEGLCKRFGTSRIPIRDAIQQLVHEGLLVNGTNGLHAVELTRGDLEDMLLIEARLHSLASRLMIQRSSDNELQTLVLINEEMRSAHQLGLYPSVAEANVRFHRQINVLAKSRRLLTALRAVSVRLHADYLTRFPEQADDSISEHEVFLRAVLDRNVTKSMAIIERHVLRTADAVIDRQSFEKAGCREIDRGTHSYESS